MQGRDKIYVKDVMQTGKEESAGRAAVLFLFQVSSLSHYLTLDFDSTLNRINGVSLLRFLGFIVRVSPPPQIRGFYYGIPFTTSIDTVSAYVQQHGPPSLRLHLIPHFSGTYQHYCYFSCLKSDLQEVVDMPRLDNPHSKVTIREYIKPTTKYCNNCFGTGHVGSNCPEKKKNIVNKTGGTVTAACSGCLSFDHVISACPKFKAADYKCPLCKTAGHTARVCPKYRGTNVVISNARARIHANEPNIIRHVSYSSQVYKAKVHAPQIPLLSNQQAFPPLPSSPPSSSPPSSSPLPSLCIC